MIDAAEELGIEEDETQFFYIAEQFLTCKLPPGWEAAPTEVDGVDHTYYFNHDTEESSWEHPLIDKYTQMFEDAKRKESADKRKRQQEVVKKKLDDASNGKPEAKPKAKPAPKPAPKPTNADDIEEEDFESSSDFEDDDTPIVLNSELLKNLDNSRSENESDNDNDKPHSNSQKQGSLSGTPTDNNRPKPNLTMPQKAPSTEDLKSDN